MDGGGFVEGILVVVEVVAMAAGTVGNEAKMKCVKHSCLNEI